MEQSRADFANNLSKYIRMSGLSQSDVANEIGVGKSTLTEWVHGRRFPRVEYIDRLAKLFGIRRGDLMGGELETLPSLIECEVRDLSADQMKRILSYIKFIKENPEA